MLIHLKRLLLSSIFNPIETQRYNPKPIMYHQLSSLISVAIIVIFLNIDSSPSSASAAAAARAPPPPSIYDHLKDHGLPIGLLPKGITDFSIDPDSGLFRINLTQPCNAKFENQLHYDFNISGQLSFGKIGELSGVSQQELFLWFPVKGIRVDVPSSGLIYFDVGVVDKQFSLSLFENPRDCTAVDPDHDHPENHLMNLGYEVGQGGKLRAVS